MKKIFESFDRFVQEMKELPGDEVEYIRIEIAKEIDDTLQRPSNDQQINKLLRKKAPNITKKNANLLLYLYKGVDENGNLLNNENVEAVIDELDVRAEKFIDSFSTQAHFLVFLNDAPILIKEYLPLMRDVARPESHQSKYMLKTAPGNFSAFDFAKKKPFAVFKDTTAQSGMKDFMHKQTPELNNIRPDHHFLFKLEYLIKIAYDIVKDSISFLAPDKDQINIDIRPLDIKAFTANYVEGITVSTQDYRKELRKTPHPSFSPMVAGQRYRMNKLFRYYYYGDYLKQSEQEQIKLIDDFMPQIIDLDTAQVQSGLVPKYSLLLSMVYKNFPQQSQKKYELPLYKILHTAKKSRFINYDIKKIIKEKGVLDRKRTKDIPFVELGYGGDTEDYRKEYANDLLDSALSGAKKGENINDTWKMFSETWQQLSKDTKDSLSDKIQELKSILQGGK